MSTRPVVFVTRCVPPNGMDMLKSECEVRTWPNDAVIPRDQLLQGVKGADGLLCHPSEKIDQEVLDAAGPQLKVIGTMSVGLEHLDLALCKSRNIHVGYTPDVLTDATAEMTVGLLLATSRRIKEGFAATVNGGWGTWNCGLYLAGKELSGSTVGIVGLGRIGLAVAKRLQPFGVQKFLYSGNSEKSWASDIGAEFVPFDILLQNSDFVVACCSMNPQNKGLFNKDAFNKMKNSAIFVNTSRGVLVNQEDLFQALSTNQILAAGLDVTTPEPLPRDNPLFTLNNCVITPHLGSATTKARAAMADLVCRNILAGLKGQPLPKPVPL